MSLNSYRCPVYAITFPIVSQLFAGKIRLVCFGSRTASSPPPPSPPPPPPLTSILCGASGNVEREPKEGDHGTSAVKRLGSRKRPGGGGVYAARVRRVQGTRARGKGLGCPLLQSGSTCSIPLSHSSCHVDIRLAVTLASPRTRPAFAVDFSFDLCASSTWPERESVPLFCVSK